MCTTTAAATNVLEQDEATKFISYLSIIKDILILIDLFQIDIAIITASAAFANWWWSFIDFIVIFIRFTGNVLKLIVIIIITTAGE